MTPYEQLQVGLDRLQSSGCQPDSSLQSFKQDYEKQADVADQRLQEQQEREQEKLESE